MALACGSLNNEMQPDQTHFATLCYNMSEWSGMRAINLMHKSIDLKNNLFYYFRRYLNFSKRIPHAGQYLFRFRPETFRVGNSHKSNKIWTNLHFHMCCGYKLYSLKQISVATSHKIGKLNWPLFKHHIVNKMETKRIQRDLSKPETHSIYKFR